MENGWSWSDEMVRTLRTLIKRAYSSFATHVLDVPARLLAFLLFVLLLLVPLAKPSGRILFVLIYANLLAIFAASWDLLVGRCGQISLGHALFFGVGAYTTAMLWKFYGLPIWVTIPAGALVGVLVAVLVGLPCLRVRGPYLALVTLAFPLILTGVLFFFKDVTGGEKGISGLPQLFPFLGIYGRRVAEYYLTLFLLLVSGVALYKIANSRTGMVFVSILDDELASKSRGINTTKYKLMAFAISALFASLAGAVFAHIVRVAAYSTLALSLSFNAVIITILGGIGTIYGPIAGAFILGILNEYVLRTVLDIPYEFIPLIFIIPVIILIIKWPRGVARFVVDKLEEFREERERRR